MSGQDVKAYNAILTWAEDCKAFSSGIRMAVEKHGELPPPADSEDIARLNVSLTMGLLVAWRLVDQLSGIGCHLDHVAMEVHAVGRRLDALGKGVDTPPAAA